MDLGRYEHLYVVRRETGGSTKVSCGRTLKLADDARARLRLQARFDNSIKEVLFARRVLLVEGSGERSAVKCLPRVLKRDFDKEGLSVIETDGKPGMIPVGEVLNAFNIPHVCLVDEGLGKFTGEPLTKKIEAICGHGNLFVMKPDFEGVVGFKGKLTPVSAMETFRKYADPGEVPAVIRAAVEKVLAL